VRRSRRQTPRHGRAAARAKIRLSLRARLILAASGAACVLLLWALVARALAPTGNTDATRFDAIIVLGATVDSDGTPSPTLLSRITEGVREYERGMAPHVIVTGGGQHGRVQAEIMARLVEAQGVPPSAVIAEPHAEDTIENACYSARIMKEQGWKSAEVVTTASHLPRTGIIFNRLPISWRGHAAPSLSAPGEGASWGASGLEVLHTGYYLLYSQWADRCSP
jgi:uncharacterized SAM-binding protein YcdF (DUF218 family)